MLITDSRKINKYYKALLDRNASFVGIFFVGVHTTSIFCIADCRARKPKLKNVSFYSELKDVLDQGFRPCKICKPTLQNLEMPEAVTRAIQLVHDHPKEKIKDYRLRQEGLDPAYLRRWFKKNHGMTFHAYQRMFRINKAFQELKEGKKSSDTAYDNGFESLSGFNYTYKKILGSSPKHNDGKNIILLSRTQTPLGPMFIAATDKGICLLEFVDRRMLETEYKDLQRLLHANIIAGENQHIKLLKKELKEYFNGDRNSFTVKLDAPGTSFQKLVWQALRDIPFGENTNYSQLALNLNKATAVRAVASANGFNRIAIVIPCHRVIGKDGQLRGYGGGLERKAWLLAHEKKYS